MKEKSLGYHHLILWLSIVFVDEYFLSRLPIVEKKLAQGGVRLAASLNRIFSSHAKRAEA